MKRLLIIFAMFCTISPAFASAALHDTLANKINAVLKDFNATTSISILVKDKRTGKTVYQKNPGRYFMPASNEKLFTAFAALQSLGKKFTYTTQLYTDTRKIKNGVLEDNIYIRFSGDPTLTVSQLDQMIHALAQAGIQRINGSVIIDDTAFDQIGMSPGTTWDDKDFCWGSPVNTIIIEGNCVSTMLSPGSGPGQPARMTLPEHPQSMQFINNVVTGISSQAKCEIKTERTGASTYTMNGCINPSMPNKYIARAIDNPRSNIQFILDYLLSKNRINNTGKYEYHHIDNPPLLLAQEKSLPLFSLITLMLKNSDNMIANSLFKTIGAHYANTAGSFKNGSDAARDILDRTVHLDIPKTTLIDGSGGSRYDFLTPQQIVTLLQKINSLPQAGILISALPVSGTDGTLKFRMRDPDTLGRVSAKTGTATAVSNLSGYLLTRKKHTLIFSIMINGFVDLPEKYEELQDKICAVLIDGA